MKIYIRILKLGMNFTLVLTLNCSSTSIASNMKINTYLMFHKNLAIDTILSMT